MALFAVVLAQLIPLLGVFLLDWDLLSILLLYWLESLLVCGLTVVRLFYCAGVRAVGLVLLFLLAFVTLSASHMAVLVTLARALDPSVLAPDLSAATDVSLMRSLEVIYGGGLTWIASERPELLTIALPALAVSLLVAYWQGPLRWIDRRHQTALTILRQALGRLIGLHMALLLGSAVIAALGLMDLLPVLVVLVLFKCLIEFRHHRQAECEARTDET